MSDKIYVIDDKFNAALKDPLFGGKKAQEWARDLLSKEFRGVGDTIEAAAYRLQTRLGVDPAMLMQGHNREPRNIGVKRWIPLFAAWWEEVGKHAANGYKSERGKHENNSFAACLADSLADEATPSEEGSET